MTEITRFTVGVEFKFSQKEQRKLDSKLKSIEAQLAKFGSKLNKSLTLNIDRFVVDQRRLNTAIGNALDIASTRNVFEISRFAIDQSRLNAMMRNAVQRASAGAMANVRTHVQQPHGMGRVARSAAVGGAAGRFLPGGGVLGAGLALAGGGYGLSALNQRNQQVVAAQLQTQAVVQQAGGTAQQGTQSFDFLRQQANRIGFNYLEAAPDFNKLLSGLTGAGVSVEESQNVFKGFAELARVNKLGRVEQNRLFRALSQVAGKGKLQSEELVGQISEALPGGTALFARAYQAQLAAEGKGGGLTGKAAIQQLLADMKAGKVKSDILTFAGAGASEAAKKGGLEVASRASQAEADRYRNTITDLAIVASQKGVEEGFARIFRTLNQGLAESGPLVTKLAQGFNEATKWADDLLLFPQSFARALEGKDSLVGDWLGTESVNQMNADLKVLYKTLQDLNGLVEGGNFMPTLKSTAQEIAAITNFFANTVRWFNSASESADIVQADVAMRGKTPFGNILAGLTGSFAGLSTFISTPWDAEGADMYRAWAEQNYPRGAQAIRDAQELKSSIANTSNTFQVSITVDPVTLANMNVELQAQSLAEKFVEKVLGNTIEQFTVKE